MNKEVKPVMRVPEWIKKLSGKAGEYYVAAEFSKRGILNALLPENFPDDDIIIGKKDGNEIGFVQVKASHSERSKTFPLYKRHEDWVNAKDNQYVVFVLLGSNQKNEPPRYWIVEKKQVGKACLEHPCHGSKNDERRFRIADLPELSLRPEWENNWKLFEKYMPQI
jgi:hypothetical protein